MRQQTRTMIDKNIVARKTFERANLNNLARPEGPQSKLCSFQTRASAA